MLKNTKKKQNSHLKKAKNSAPHSPYTTDSNEEKEKLKAFKPSFKDEAQIFLLAKLDGDIVECPLHFWHYNIKTGELKDYLKDIKLQTYKTDVRDDGVYIDL